MTDQELKDLVASLAVKSDKTDEHLKETGEFIKETGEFIKETGEQIKANSEEIKANIKEMRLSQKKTDEHLKETGEFIKETGEHLKETGEFIKETGEQMKKTDKKIKEVSSQLGNIGKNQGDVAEEFFINSIASTLKVGRIQYDELNQNMAKRTKKLQGEFDIVLINGQELLIIETKYKAHNNDVDDLINKKHTNFKKLYPQYNDYIQHLGLASFYINDDTKEKALSNSVMILQRKGDILETILPSN